MRVVPSVAACLAACLVLPACSSGPKLAKVTGKVTYNQQPLPASNSSPTIVFHPVVEKGKALDSYPATYQKDKGTFEVSGRSGAGIPEGKYRVSVQFLMPKAGSLQEKWSQQFTPEKSPILREVSGEAKVDIDLARPQS